MSKRRQPKGWKQYYREQKQGKLPAWNYALSEAEKERRAMKKLYQEKSGDYSY